MLDEGSYTAAIYTYIGAACVVLVYMTWWLSRHWRAAWVSFTVLILSALLLTPASSAGQSASLAPAVIVAAFEGLMHGPEAALPALKPLMVMLGLAVGIALLLGCTVFRTRSAEKISANAKKDDAQAS